MTAGAASHKVLQRVILQVAAHKVGAGHESLHRSVSWQPTRRPPQRSAASTISPKTWSWSPLRGRPDDSSLCCSLPPTAEAGKPDPYQRHVDRGSGSSIFPLLVRSRPSLRRPSTAFADRTDERFTLFLVRVFSLKEAEKAFLGENNPPNPSGFQPYVLRPIDRLPDVDMLRALPQGAVIRH